MEKRKVKNSFGLFLQKAKTEVMNQLKRFEIHYTIAITF